MDSWHDLCFDRDPTMKRLVYSLTVLPLVACTGGERANTGQCPAGEVCSAKTPNGLHFIGRSLADDVTLSGPAPTAIGGTQDVTLQYDRGDGFLVALDLPYLVDDDGAGGVRFDGATGAVATITGIGSRANYLRVLDPADNTLFDRKQLTGAALDTITLVDPGFERIPVDAQLVWATGAQDVGVALFGQVQETSGPMSERLVDDTMTATLAGADRTAWDTFHAPNAVAGTVPVTVAAGDKPATTLDFTVVTSADALAAIAPPTKIAPSGSQIVCFQATNATRYVVGLTWSYNVDGVQSTRGAGTQTRNCIVADTTKTSGTVSVQASAGGQSATVTLAVSAMARELPSLGVPTRVGNERSAVTAGDRAAALEDVP
ncbi:MAG: hypothetical protein JWO36_5547 [Myxococcales bacterium]|nr:hypothetical protein [Myxococcales bacterium]